VELRNQIDYLDQRCVGVDTTAAAAPAARGAASGSTGVTGRKISVNEAGKKSGIPSPATSRATGAQPATQYTIQVVAYSTRQAAEKMRASLLARGYEARVYGSQRPYRVRIGRYDSRQAADSVAAEMRAKHMSAYVTEAERP
jgi:cell division protein FtsN